MRRLGHRRWGPCRRRWPEPPPVLGAAGGGRRPRATRGPTWAPVLGLRGGQAPSFSLLWGGQQPPCFPCWRGGDSPLLLCRWPAPPGAATWPAARPSAPKGGRCARDPEGGSSPLPLFSLPGSPFSLSWVSLSLPWTLSFSLLGSPFSLSLSSLDLSLSLSPVLTLSPLINSLSLTPGLSLLCSLTRISPPRAGDLFQRGLRVIVSSRRGADTRVCDLLVLTRRGPHDRVRVLFAS